MKIILPILCLALFCSSSYGQSKAGQSKAGQSKIVGGTNTNNGDYPWMVSINTKGANVYNGQFCGGALIHSSWVLTAAHCMEGENAGGIEVWVNIHDLDNPGVAQRRDVRAIYVHPGYREDADGDLYNDIALLLLASPTTGITPIGYPSNPNSAPAGTTVTALGWGDTQSTPKFPSILQEVDLSTVTIARLRNDLRENRLDSKHLGAVGQNKDTCQGDSGGPLFIPGPTPVLVGITSFGLGCADGTAGVYANVGNYKSFLDNFLSQPTTGDPDVSITGRGRTIPDGSRGVSRARNTNFGGPFRRSRTKTFNVLNDGVGIPMKTSVSVSGRQFSIAKKPGIIFQNNSSTLRVRFRSRGVRRSLRGTVKVRTNDPANPFYTFRVKARSK